MESNNISIWDNCTNLYSIQKTLRFELKPIGETLNQIKKEKLIEEDKIRSDNFYKAKKIMDEYYKYFIEKSLQKVRLPNIDLETFFNLYSSAKRDKNNDELKKKIAELQKLLRKKIYEQISNNKEFNYLFKKEFLLKVLIEWLKNQNRNEDLNIISEFTKWNTYFTGFFENRKNVFSVDEKPTSIIYRIVHDNLPKYLDNLERFNKIKQIQDFPLSDLNQELKEVLEEKNIIDLITLENFNLFLCQKGIDLYNTFLGGYSIENEKNIKGLNQYINLYSQSKLEKNEQKEIRKLKLVPLFKQILSDKTTISFLIDNFNDDLQLFKEIDGFYTKAKSKINKLKLLFSNISDFDLSQIYIRKDSINRISQQIFDDWNILNQAIFEKYKKELSAKNEKTIQKYIKNQKYFSVLDIQNGLKLLDFDKDISEFTFQNYLTGFKEKDTCFDILIDDKYNLLKQISVTNDRSLLSEKKEKDVELIKNFLDSLLNLYHFLKQVHIDQQKQEDSKEQFVLELDSSFYLDFEDCFETISEIVVLYNKVRNYVTQKPFKTDKFKLNFDSSSFLNGWDSNFDTKSGLLFLDNNNYYVGIIPKKLSTEDLDKINSKPDNFYMVKYDFQKPDNKQTPRLFIRSKGENFSPAVKEYNLPINDILEIYDNGYFKTEFRKKDEEKYKKSLVKLIDYFKLGFTRHKSYKHYNFLWKNSEEYENISDFYKDVMNSCYNLNFQKINYKEILNLVSEGKIYLFKIWNKDFSEFSKGKKNLHTIYWKELFSEANLKNIIYKLNGQAEIFYREKSISEKDKIIHNKNEIIKNKDPIKEKKESIFKYDLIKDRRYTDDKFFFHCPITINFQSKENSYEINSKINKLVSMNLKDMNILSIDRGERHLLYYTLLDSKGNILEQNSLNIIEDDLKREKSYRDKLDQLEKKRQESRRTWKTINNIKELKSGYLSQIIHNISNIAIKNNAVIILEDLNFGFKRGRFKIEKQVYQKFEKMLIDKLNYLVFKDRNISSPGSSLKAYQLTSKFDTFKKLGKQTGILYYIPASYTSKICPRTGFVNLLYPKYTNQKEAIDFINKFDNIKYNKFEDYFEFTFKYSNFIKDSKLKKDCWTICTYKDRIITQKSFETKGFISKSINMTDEFKRLFENKISYENKENIKEQLLSINSKKFYEEFFCLLKYTLQMRNSYTDNELKNLLISNKIHNESDGDYILSCVKDKNGEFFDSRKPLKYEPKNADANGAYHIGIKGLMMLRKMKNMRSEKPEKLDRNDFLNYVQEIRNK